tara:strand:- start:346 stop:699 length:354 start_codon:yes stop_codon:yes gene_type:complete
MKTIIKTIISSILLVNSSFAFHDVEVANEEIAVLGGVWTQIFTYEEYCFDNQYYDTVIDRLMISPRFERYSDELGHLNERQELAWERGATGAAAVISAGETDCDVMASVIWEWFGEN